MSGCVGSKDTDCRDKLGYISAFIVYFWPAWVGRNPFVNTKFTRPVTGLRKCTEKEAKEGRTGNKYEEK